MYLYESVINVLDRLSPHISKKNLKVNINLPENIVIFADPQYLDTILFNLIENAVKYTPSGGKLR